jgi:hypothetical protein
MESLQLDASNLSDQPGRTSISFSGVGHFHLAGKNFHLCMQYADPVHQLGLKGRAVLSCGDIGVSFPPVLPALGELRLPFTRYAPQPHTESGDAQEQGCHLVF